MVVWDNLSSHDTPAVREFVDAHDWITVFHLPSYAPEFNPVEGVWATVKRGLGNFATRTIDQPAATIKRLLKQIQYRPDLINSYITGTGLDLSATAIPP